MAYMNQDRKRQIAAAVKPILKQYGMKGTLSVRHHSAIVLTLTEGPIDFGKTYTDVNQYWIHDHYEGAAREFLEEIYAAMQAAGWYDRSDAMTDYFDTAYYISIRVGKWNKNYVCTDQKVVAEAA